MIQIDDKIIGSAVFEEQFICDLPNCLGVCCVQGISGAPLDLAEVLLLEDDLEKIIPFLKPEGVEAIRELGVVVTDFEGDLTTPLINGKECAFCIEEKGISQCGIERAYKQGKTKFQKPVSCHLYPIRIKTIGEFTAINYDHWDICNHARVLGEKEGVPVYQFLKEPIIRRFGEDFYQQLEEAARLIRKEKEQ
ncbi:MAG TPA: DUF3109 family protein [Williamwhitmania sp.]|nr:DUF3109 family protein [Williamwhitmania sp.]